jgi:hypothetical protein
MKTLVFGLLFFCSCALHADVILMLDKNGNLIGNICAQHYSIKLLASGLVRVEFPNTKDTYLPPEISWEGTAKLVDDDTIVKAISK